MKLNITKIKNWLRRQNPRRCFFNFLSGGGLKILLFGVVILVSGYCVYIWYNFVYKPSWSDKRQQEYIKSKDKGAVFNRTQFEKIISEIESRKTRFGGKIENLEDIFRINK